MFFQAREAANRFYDACPGIVERVMERFGAVTGRRYGLFDYAGPPAGRARACAHGLGGRDRPRDCGVPGGVRRESGRPQGAQPSWLFRGSAFIAALPPTIRAIAVLDRTKEPGALGASRFTSMWWLRWRRLAPTTNSHPSPPSPAWSRAAMDLPRRNSRRQW